MSDNIKLPDQDARDTIKDNTGANFVVEAAAGTGKTRSLSDRIMTLIEKGAVIEHIAAITFTRMAAGELAERIRQALGDKIDDSENSDQSVRFKKALRDLPTADISTIHSFCERLLREFPTEAKIDPAFEVIDEAGADKMFDELWDKYWINLLEDGESFIKTALFFGLKYADIKKMAEERLLFRDLDVPEVEDAEFPDPGYVIENINEYVEFIRGKLPHCTDEEDNGFIKCNKIINAHRNFESDIDSISSDSEKDQFKVSYAYSFKPLGGQGAKTKWDPPDTITEIKDRKESMEELGDDYKKEIRKYLYGKVRNLVEDFLRYFNTEKRKHSVVDFTDILLDTRNLLKNNPDIRKRLSKRYDNILVDEFQDTDPLQAEIVFYLSQDQNKTDSEKDKKWNEVTLDEGKLFIVGDPKQSIYRFRRADISIYETAKNRFNKRLNLQTNFRSRPALINFINEVFGGETGRIQPKEGIQPEYVPLKPCAYIKDSEREHIIGVDINCETPENINALVSEEAFAVARLLKNLIKEKYQIRDPASSVKDPNYTDLRPGHIMLLSPTRTHFGIISSAFEQEGFYVEPDEEKIYAGALIPRVIEILRAVTRPDDSIAVVAGLRSLLLGVDDEKLMETALDNMSFNLGYLLAKKDNLDEKVKVAVEMLGEMRNMKKDLPPDEFIRKSIDFCGSHIMAAAGDNFSPDVRRLESLKNIISEKISISLSPESALEEAVKELTELEAKNPGIVEENKIRMMTVHQSKGLESPVVALMNAGHARKNSVKNIPLRDENSILIKYSAKTVIVSGNLKLTPAQWKDNEEEEKEQNIAEYERQRYVAATRAKDLLVVPISHKYKKDKYFVAPIADKLKSLADGNDKIKIVKSTKLIGPDSDSEVDTKYITDYNDVPFLPDTESVSRDSDRDINSGWEAVEKEQKDNLKRMKEESWTVTAVTKAADKIRKDKNIKQLTSVAASILGRRDTFGTEGGVFFHELYEKLLKYSDINPEKLINYCLAETEYKLDNKAQLIEKSRRLIEKWKDTPEFKRIKGADKLLIETPFFYKESEKKIIYTGIIDIMIKESDEWTIIDLKSDMMDKSIEDRPEIQKALEPYNFQLEIYKKAVKNITGEKVKEARLLFLDE